MRQFFFTQTDEGVIKVTVGQILEDLKKLNINISRMTYYRLEKQERLNFPKPHRTEGKIRWRLYTPEEAEKVKQIICKEYGFAYSV